jgi:hypothetical protein
MLSNYTFSFKKKEQYLEKILDSALFSPRFKNKIFPILFSYGMRGNSFCNILQAHPEVYYLPDNSLYKSDSYFKASQYDSLATEDELCVIYGLGTYTDIYRYASFNNARNRMNNLENTALLPYVTEKHYDKLLFMVTHYTPEEAVRPSIDKIIKKLYNSDKPFVHMYGTLNRPLFPNVYIEPLSMSTAFNVNIDMLYSTNYNNFESEYIKIIKYFKLTSQIDRVWIYILKTLKIQESLRKYDYYDTNPFT